MKVVVNFPDGKIHSTSWVYPWIEYLKENHIEYETADLFRTQNVMEKLKGFDILLWHFSNYNHKEMLEARNILYAAEKMGLLTFPSFNDAWHFDDKIAEMYALESIGAPIPKSWVYYDIDTLKKDIEAGEYDFPIIAKLKSGSGSHNVKMIKSKGQLLGYARRMFGRGYNPAPSLWYKTSSNVRSSHDKSTFMHKLHRVPEFLRTLKGARRFPHENDYVYLQEFIHNDGFDMKVVVVGDKLSGLYRPTRSHDFRASGGGEVHYDKTLFHDDIIKSAFAAADALGLICVGFDYVIDKRTGNGVIVEMSYGFSHEAVMGMNGWFDRDCQWHEGALNAPKELLYNMLERCQKEKGMDPDQE